MFRILTARSGPAAAFARLRTPARFGMVAVIAGAFLSLGILAGPASPAFAAGAGCGTTVPSDPTTHTGGDDPGTTVTPPTKGDTTPGQTDPGAVSDVNLSAPPENTKPTDPQPKTNTVTSTATTPTNVSAASTGVVGTVRHALAVTGHNVMPAVAIACLLLMTGVGSIIIVRRRRA